MRNPGLLLITCALLCLFSCQNNGPNASADFADIPVAYPDTYRDSAYTTSYAGYKVAAPYHWLEKDSSAVRDWVNAQASIAYTFFEELPGRDLLSNQLDILQDYVDLSPPSFIDGAYYFLRSEKGIFRGLYKQQNLEDEATLLIDPKKEGWASTSYIAGFSASADGELLAIRLAERHSEWEEILVYDLKQGSFLQDNLSDIRHSNITWYRDGFFYSRYDRPENNEEPFLFQQIYFHRAGTDQSDDELVYADRSDPRYRFSTFLSRNQEYLILITTNSEGLQSVYARPARQPDAPFFDIAEDLGHQFEWAGSDGDYIYLVTNLEAPNRKLIRIDPDLPGTRFWKTILPAGNTPLESVHWANGNIVAIYRGQNGDAMAVYDKEGQLLKRPKLPDHGAVIDISSEYKDKDIFIAHGQLLEPPQIYRLDLEAERMTTYHTPVIAFDPAAFEVRLVTLKSYDDNDISMYIAHKQDIKLNGQHPVLLFAGGNPQGPYAPLYQVQERLIAQLMLQQGGICAIPALRGGSALRTANRRAGQREYKQNTLDDFQAAAEYLIANKYTKASKIGVYGAGQGGLIAAASLAQRPDLFGAVAGVDGLYDLLRYPEQGADWKWLPEFGDPGDPKQFDHLFAYSPVQKWQADDYPALLLAANEDSDAIIPSHTWKMGAVAQRQQSGNAPALVYPISHTEPFTTTGSDIMAFLMYHLKTPVQE